MSDGPQSYADLQAENAALRGQVGQLQTSIGSLQSSIAARDAEIAGLKKPKVQRRLDTGSADKFQRPFARRSR